MSETSIPWADYTINVIFGCRNNCGVTADNPAGWCYARKAAPHVARQVAAKTGKPICQACLDFEPHLHPERLAQIGKGKPALVFMDSMSDWWSPGVDPDWQWRATDAMAKAPQHRFVVLTKRPARITPFDIQDWPSSAWLGVSITSGDDWWRWEALAKLPGRIHKLISVEPLLGPGVGASLVKAVADKCIPSWVVLGPLSGPGEKPRVAEWQEVIRECCQFANIPLFEKPGLPLQPAIRQMPADLALVFRKQNLSSVNHEYREQLWRAAGDRADSRPLEV